MKLFIIISLWQGLILSTQATERVALIIGNGDYQKFGTLDNPVNDAKDIAQALKSLGFKVTLEINTTQRTMQKAVRKFSRQLPKDSIGLFYYAGHGTQYRGENYLIPTDFNGGSASKYEQQSISANQILADMKRNNSHTTIMILDACRNNPFAKSTTRSLTRNTKVGLAEMQETSGSIIAFSTKAGKVAYDGDGRNSPYAYHLKNFIKDPEVPIESMFKRVRTAVVRETEGKENGTQVPSEVTSLMGADFCFAGCRKNNSRMNNHNITKPCKIKWGSGEYQGECRNGKPHGFGTQRYTSGEYYVGSFKSGLRHGEGKQYLSDGFEIVADWENGLPK